MSEHLHVSWSKEMSVHSEELDNQHRHLVEIILELEQSYHNGELEGILGCILDKLSQYIVYHFTMEEVYFDMFDFYDKENHKNEHRNFREKIEEFIAKYKSNDSRLSDEIIAFMRNWLYDHVMLSDQKYVECFMKHGLSDSN